MSTWTTTGTVIPPPEVRTMNAARCFLDAVQDTGKWGGWRGNYRNLGYAPSDRMQTIVDKFWNSLTRHQKQTILVLYIARRLER